MTKQTKTIVASVVALLLILLVVLCYFVFFGARVKCNYCEEMYFEKQGKVAPLFGMMCPDCYEEFLAEFGGDDDDDDDKNDSSNHVHTEVIDAEVAATCSETGLTEGKRCSECGKILKAQSVIPMIPHTYDNSDDTKCNVCGFDRVLDCEHNDPRQIITIPAKAPSCIETGLTEGKQCNICGTMIVTQTVIPTTECTNLKTLPYKAPTCQETGLTAGKQCNDCGKIVVSQSVIPTECTTFEVLPYKEPTCSESGLTEGKKCTLCGKIIEKQETIPTLDCVEGSEIVDQVATKTQDGYSHTECEACHKIMSEFVIGAGSQGLDYQMKDDGTLMVYYIGTCTDRNIVIPKVYYNLPITSIDAYAFSDSTEITSITIPNSITSIGEYAFWNCASLTSITIPNSVKSIGDYAFSSCTSLEGVIIPNSVTSIGDALFYNCTSLSSIELGTGITEIRGIYDSGYYGTGYFGMFGNCTSLTEIIIPNSVEIIGDGAFDSCTSLSSITIPNSVTSIGEYAFFNCTSLTDITIPNSVTSIGGNAFCYCTSLNTVTIPNSITDIAEYTFGGCTSLKSVTIPVSVTSIGAYAFNDANLENIYYSGTMEEWNAIDKEVALCGTYYTVHCSNGNIEE